MAKKKARTPKFGAEMMDQGAGMHNVGGGGAPAELSHSKHKTAGRNAVSGKMRGRLAQGKKGHNPMGQPGRNTVRASLRKKAKKQS